MKKLLELNLDDIKVGLSFYAKRTVIVYRGEQNQVRALKNICRHQGGQFAAVDAHSCNLRCPNHGWQLDVSKMEYTNPSGGLKHVELPVEVSSTGVVSVFELPQIKPWEVNLRPRTAIKAQELVMRFYSHACMEIKAGSHTIFTDPWLEGPCCVVGWWLEHQPPADWLKSLVESSVIYISHNHSDHLHPHSLQLLAEKRRDNLFVVPAYQSRSVEIPLLNLGFTNVLPLPFGVWHELDEQTRLMILPDTTGRDDSGLLVEYKGHLVLNTVDCSNLNDGVLPETVDVLLSPFSGASSGFPVCWEELYSEAKIKEIVDRNLHLSLKQFTDAVKQTKPKFAVPFAGYFRAAHPDDKRIAETNPKNSQAELGEQMSALFPEVQYWPPSAGATLDCATGAVSGELDQERSLESYNFDRYLREVEDDALFAPLQSLEGIRTYFLWANFSANQVLHVIETDNSFTTIVRQFMYDFLTQEFVTERPSRKHQYSRMRVRSAAFRHVLRRGLPWEDISSGFQARFYREPDIYEFAFWDHFQNRLPIYLPWDRKLDAGHAFDSKTDATRSTSL